MMDAPRPWLLALAVAVAMVPGACNSGDGLLRAKVIERRDEVVGGPVAMADIGDYLLENDQIRVAILGARDSPGPGVFGGAVVDIDLRRARIGFEGGQGHDRFAETFPLANLLVPDPTGADVRVLHDGSDGHVAGIRVEGNGQFLFEALSVLRDKKDALELFFPDVRTSIRFRTDYLLHPGDRHVTVQTTLLLPDAPAAGCPGLDACEVSCPNGHLLDDKGCHSCECSGVTPLENATAPTSVFGGILGDATNDPMNPQVKRAGIVAGDFVFFGNQNDVFAPGPGFDEDTAVQDAYISGRNTFQEPLTFDFVAAAGGDISYGYFTVAQGDTPVQVNVPLFASAATSFLAAGKNCLVDPSDDDVCDKVRAFSYERYIAVGDGDIASVAEEMYRVRGTSTGTLLGNVYWSETGEPARNAHVYVFSDPHPDSAKAWRSVDDLAEANRRARGDVGLLTAIDADVGLDLVEDGDFHAELPPGRYVIAARDEDGVVLSPPLKVQVRAGKQTIVAPVLPTAGTLEFQVTDESGTRMPAKLALVALDDHGAPLEGDGLRKVYLGDDRLGNGKREVFLTASGEGEERIEPGRYRLIVSRGIEYAIHTEELEIGAGQVRRVDVVLPREIDTSGWMSTDMHLHATPSFDSGMPLPRRVTTAAAEGVELAVSTDHDVESDYRPAIQELLLGEQLATAIGAEITTLEQGHFIGFPLRFDALDVPRHGAHDWTCEAGGTILSAIKASGDGSVEPFTIVAHPRDGFFGYIDQLGVDGYTLNRKLSLLEESNPVFRTAGCNFDGSEIINGKRFDLVRTPSVAEVADWNRCLARVNAAASIDELDVACPEAGAAPLAPCTEAERFNVCKGRHRTALAWTMMKRLLARTPEEQDANWSFTGDQKASQKLCDLDALGDMPVPDDIKDQPCTYRPGQVDDFFRYLEHGFRPTQISSSDSHNGSREPGFPRTFFRSPTDAPSGISIVDAVESLRGGHALATYGPFLRASIQGESFGDVAKASPGDSVPLELDVQTASWFGVDRVEVYLNGRIVKVLEPTKPPSAIVDVHGKVTIPVPDRDSWVIVIAMGLRDENLMRPVSLDIPYGEVQLSKIAADAFALIPAISSVFKKTPTVPDWSPTPPYAISNPIYIDTDGNGRYDAPLPFPEFCSRPCDPAGADDQCPTDQKCLDQEKVCGVAVLGACDHRRVTIDAH